MDGTSKAAENCRILPILEGQLLTMDKYIDGFFENHKMLATFKPTTQPDARSSVSTLFEETQNVVLRMFKRGFFDKPWILIPLNIDQSHWVTVALLNTCYLGTDQDKVFTGFAYIDNSDLGEIGPEVRQTLMRKGIFNAIIYANLLYGKANLRDAKNYVKLLNNPETFPQILVTPCDWFEQNDNHNCGIYVCLSVLEICTVHSFNYKRRSDFDVDEVGDCFFKEGDWFKLFRNHERPESDVVTSKTGVTFLRLPRQMFIDFQAQVKVLWCRIFAVKRGEVKSNIMFTSSGMPKHVRRNLHHFVWGYPRDDQEQIDEFFSWSCTIERGPDVLDQVNKSNYQTL